VTRKSENLSGEAETCVKANREKDSGRRRVELIEFSVACSGFANFSEREHGNSRMKR